MGNVLFYMKDKFDLNQVEKSYEKSFKRKFDKKYWEWRYLKNPLNDNVYAGYIQDNKQIVAFLGSSPYKIQTKENELKDIAFLNIVFTDPEFQGKGYFNSVVKETLNLLEESNFVATYGFPNHNSHYGFRKKMNWTDLSVLNTFQLDKKNIKHNVHDSNNFEFKINLVEEKDIEKAILMNFKTSNTYIDRSFDFLKWRLIDIPNQQYYSLKIFEKDKLIGLIFYKMYGTQTDIMEFFYDKDEEEKKYSIFNSASFYLFNTSDKINMWSNLYSEEHLALEKIGFKETEFSAYFGIIPFQNIDEITNFKNWHIRFLDSDVY